ncbi:MAG: hypothetical protein M1823_000514 [Watsoniomyces obsoletus]|nr:MAG: hypothetical protein M1823_000514 [Watsoniomyces obsoletus]
MSSSPGLLITTLVSIRGLIGISAIATPGLLAQTFLFPTSPSHYLMTRLFGSRDLTIAGLLWTARTPEERRRALMIGAITDGIDAVSSAVCVATGATELLPAALAGGGAAVLCAMGVWGMRQISTGPGSGSGENAPLAGGK